MVNRNMYNTSLWLLHIHVSLLLMFEKRRLKQHSFDFTWEICHLLDITAVAGHLAWLAVLSELEYLWSQLANLDQILYVASLGVGKGCLMFWGRLDQNSGVHGNRKPPLTYNGENDVSTFSHLFLIRSFLYLQVTRTCIKSQASSNFGQIGPMTMELAALQRLKNFP